MSNTITLPYTTSSGVYGTTLSSTYEWYVQWYQYPTNTSTVTSSAYMKVNSIKKNSFIKKNLQEGYTHVKYIESTGTQYIDTQYIPNSNTRIIMDFQSTQVPSGWFGFFSSRDGSSNSYANQFALWMNSSGVFRSNYYTDTGIYLDSSISSTGRHIIDHNKNIVTMDDVVVATHTATTFNGTYNLFLFAGHTDGTIELPSSMKLYSCKIYDNDILIRDYVPCVNANGIAGLYDLVNHAFYQNSGSGNFIIDENESDDITANISIYSQNAITRTGTSGYTCSTFTFKSQPTILLHNKALGESVEVYDMALTTTVADNGAGTAVSGSIVHASTLDVTVPSSWFIEENRQWYFTISDLITIVDTGVTHTNTKTFDTFVVDALYNVWVKKSISLPDGYTQLKYIESTGTQYVDTGINATSSNYNTLKLEYDMLIPNTNGSTWATSGSGVLGNAIHIGVHNGEIVYGGGTTDVGTGVSYDYTRKTWINDLKNGQVIVDGTTIATYTPNAPTTSLNLFLFGYNHTTPVFFNARFYSAKFYENDVLIRYFIPVVDYNNVPCFYEQVSGTFFYNKGTGTFTSGYAVGEPVREINQGTILRKAISIWVRKNGVLHEATNLFTKVGGEVV